MLAVMADDDIVLAVHRFDGPQPLPLNIMKSAHLTLTERVHELITRIEPLSACRGCEAATFKTELMPDGLCMNCANDAGNGLRDATTGDLTEAGEEFYSEDEVSEGCDCDRCGTYLEADSPTGFCAACNAELGHTLKCILCGAACAPDGDICKDCGNHQDMRKEAERLLCRGDLFRAVSGNILKSSGSTVHLESGECSGCDSPSYLVNLDQYGMGRCCSCPESVFA